MVCWLDLQDKKDLGDRVTLVPRAVPTQGYFNRFNSDQMGSVIRAICIQEDVEGPLSLSDGMNNGVRVFYALFKRELGANRFMDRISKRNLCGFSAEPGVIYIPRVQ